MRIRSPRVINTIPITRPPVLRCSQFDETFGEAALWLARDERADPRGCGGADFAPAVALVPSALHRLVERVFGGRGGDVAGDAVVDDLRVAADVRHDRHAAGE